MRKLIERFLSVFDFEKPGLAILKLPTGYGKTELFIELSKMVYEKGLTRVIYASPLRTLNEDLYNKLCDKLCETVKDDSPKKDVARQYMDRSESPFFNKRIIITTIDTLGLNVHKIPTPEMINILKEITRGHYTISRANIANSVLLVDEPHLAFTDAGLRTLFYNTLYYLMVNKATVILASATITNSMIKQIEEVKNEAEKSINSKLQYLSCIYGHKCDFFEKSVDEDFNSTEMDKEVSFTIIKTTSIIEEVIKNAIATEGRRKLIILNTVKEAIQVYKALKENMKESTNLLLLHGLLSQKDREKRTNELLGKTGKKNCCEHNSNGGSSELLETEKKNPEYVLVATQVVEAGLDISADLLITDVAPIQSIIQRLGRIARKDYDKQAKAIIIIDENKLKQVSESVKQETKEKETKIYYGPYEIEEVKVAIEVLEANKGRFKPKLPINLKDYVGYMNLVEEVDGKMKTETKIRYDNLPKELISLSPFDQEKHVADVLSGKLGRDSDDILAFIKEEDDRSSIKEKKEEKMDRLRIPFWILRKIVEGNAIEHISIETESGTIEDKSEVEKILKEFLNQPNLFFRNIYLINKQISGITITRELYNKIAFEGVYHE